MRITIVGIKDVNFTPKDSDRPVFGQNVYFEYDDKFTRGFVTDRCFLPSGHGTLDPVDLPCEAEIYYNKFGKVDSIVLK